MRAPIAVALVAVVAVLALALSIRLYDWRSDRALWSSSARLSSLKPRPLFNLGASTDDAAMLLRARRAAESRSTTHEGRLVYRLSSYHLGRLAATSGDTAAALRYFADAYRPD